MLLEKIMINLEKLTLLKNNYKTFLYGQFDEIKMKQRQRIPEEGLISLKGEPILKTYLITTALISLYCATFITRIIDKLYK